MYVMAIVMRAGEWADRSFAAVDLAYLRQAVLAVVPQPRQVLGIAAQEPFLRKNAPKGQSCAQRRSRERESQVWSRMVHAVGPPPEGSTWVHVGDRYSFIFDFMEACR